jgi:hypothetical protein
MKAVAREERMRRISEQTKLSREREVRVFSIYIML